MTIRTKVILLALVCAIPAFLLGRIIWPDPVDAPSLTAIQTLLFIIVSAVEAIAFGLGVSFIAFGNRLLKNAAPDLSRHASWAFWAIAWTLVSWWPHDNMHRSNGMMNVWGLLRIEYIFHISLIASALIIASYFLRTLRQK